MIWELLQNAQTLTTDEYYQHIIINTDEDPRLRIESFAMIILRGISTKLYFNLLTTDLSRKEIQFDLEINLPITPWVW